MVKAKAKTKPAYREGTLGWWLVQAGWTPIEQVDCPRGGRHKKDQHGRCERCYEVTHPLWQFADFGPQLTGWEARRLELVRIHNEFKAKGARA